MAGRDLHESTQARGPQGPERVVESRDHVLERSLVRIRDLAGRPRGTGFAADHRGTLITSHEAVDGLPQLILDAPGPGERSRVVTADAITALPALNLALLRTEGLGVEPLPVTVRDGVRSGTYVRIAADHWREARVLGAATVTYTATDRFHLLDGVTELAIGTAGREALRPGGGAAGGRSSTRRPARWSPSSARHCTPVAATPASRYRCAEPARAPSPTSSPATRPRSPPTAPT